MKTTRRHFIASGSTCLAAAAALNLVEANEKPIPLVSEVMRKTIATSAVPTKFRIERDFIAKHIRDLLKGDGAPHLQKLVPDSFFVFTLSAIPSNWESPEKRRAFFEEASRLVPKHTRDEYGDDVAELHYLCDVPYPGPVVGHRAVVNLDEGRLVYVACRKDALAHKPD